MNPSSIAATIAEELADELRGRKALLIGEGQTSHDVAAALRSVGYWEISVAPGGEQSATASAAASTDDALLHALAEADLVLACGDGPVLCATLVRNAMRGRLARPLAFIEVADAALDPEIADLPCVSVVSAAELHARADSAPGRPQDTEVAGYRVDDGRLLDSSIDGRAIAPVTAALRAKAEQIRERELARALAALPDASDAVKEQMEAMSLSLVGRIIDELSSRLRSESTAGPVSYTDAARDLLRAPEKQGGRPQS